MNLFPPVPPPAPATPPAPAREPRQVYTVGQLTRRIKSTLESACGRVWVAGEISNLKRQPSGHQYFSLKDADAQLAAVLFAGIGARVRFALKDGLEVVCFGLITVYEPQGKYQLKIEIVEPKGKGALQLAFEQLKEKLEKEGLFDSARKRPLPHLPRRIGIVTSPAGAALRDILNVLDRRFREVDVLLAPARVQGEGAAAEIAAAIALLNRQPGIDVMIVGRGGGSIEDLWAFNEEVVARAIAASRIPVVSAVGHEVDVTIADLVADKRALTPTEAAELVCPRKADLLAGLDAQRRRLDAAPVERLAALRARVEALAGSYALRHPQDRIAQAAQRLDELEGRLRGGLAARVAFVRERVNGLGPRLAPHAPTARLGALREDLRRERTRLAAGLAGVTRLERERLLGLARRLAAQVPVARLAAARARVVELGTRAGAAATRRVAAARERAAATAGRLEAVSPLAVLARGYSLTRRAADGAVVRAAGDVAAGDVLDTRLAQGEIRSQVL